MNTFKEMCISYLAAETDATCQLLQPIIQEVLWANRHIDREILCNKLRAEAEVFNHLIARDTE